MIQKGIRKDLEEIVKSVYQLWESHTKEEFESLLEDEKNAIFLYKKERLIAFVKGFLREAYVEGTHTSPVGFQEVGRIIRLKKNWISKNLSFF